MKRPTKPLPIRSEMTAPRQPTIPTRRAITSVRLREFEDGNSTALEMVTDVLQNVYAATLPDICGATGRPWASIHEAVKELQRLGYVRINKNVSPEEIAWKG